MSNKCCRSDKNTLEPQNEMPDLSKAQKEFADDLFQGLVVNEDYIVKAKHDDAQQYIMVATDYPEVLNDIDFREHLALMVWRFKPNAVLQFPSWAFSRDDTPVQFVQDDVRCVALSVTFH